VARSAQCRHAEPVSGGHVLHEAATIREARAILAREPIDVILLDVRPPDGSGLDLAAEVAAGPSAGDPRPPGPRPPDPRAETSVDPGQGRRRAIEATRAA
jgi:CheY-like chemotaxis protein